MHFSQSQPAVSTFSQPYTLSAAIQTANGIFGMMAHDADGDESSRSRKRRRSRSRSRGAKIYDHDRRGQVGATGRRRRSRSADERHARTSDTHGRVEDRHPLNHRTRPAPTSRAHPRHWFAKEYDPIQIGSIDGTDTTPHDKALVRALHARFDASRDPKIEGDPYRTLFVGRLSYATTEDALAHFFAQYGEVRRVRLVRDIATQHSKGYAFVEFEQEHAFVRAYRDSHRQELDGHTILVDFERGRVMPGWKPRRLGGGLGGKKESGQLRFGGRDHPFKPPAMQQQ